jgi:DNA-binding XRE family transcriptional regulator
MEKHVASWSKRLRQERERHGWSQSQLAEKIGVDTKTIGRWENGKTLPRLDCRALLCELYGKTAEELGLIKEDTDTRQNEQEVKNPTAIPTVLRQTDTRPIDWGEAPQVRQLYGRDRECALLEQWIVDDKSQVVAVLGTGGIGKTALTVKVAEKIQQRFDYVFWRSLQNAPPLEQILQKCILFLSL